MFAFAVVFLDADLFDAPAICTCSCFLLKREHGWFGTLIKSVSRELWFDTRGGQGGLRLLLFSF